MGNSDWADKMMRDHERHEKNLRALARWAKILCTAGMILCFVGVSVKEHNTTPEGYPPRDNEEKNRDAGKGMLAGGVISLIAATILAVKREQKEKGM